MSTDASWIDGGRNNLRMWPVCRGLFVALALVVAMVAGGFTGCVIDDTDVFENVPQLAAESELGGEPSTPASAPSMPMPRSSSLGSPGAGGGFLWKPVSESDNRLVVLLPPSYNGVAINVMIVQSNGTVMDQGRFAGIHNGNRSHFRFSQPGAGYGSGVYVVADLNTGETVHWYITNGASRNQY